MNVENRDFEGCCIDAELHILTIAHPGLDQPRRHNLKHSVRFEGKVAGCLLALRGALSAVALEDRQSLAPRYPDEVAGCLVPLRLCWWRLDHESLRVVTLSRQVLKGKESKAC